MRYARYIWPALLLVAAALAPDAATVVTLLIAGTVTVLLTLSREKRLAQLVRTLSDLLSFEQKTASIALERSLNKIQHRMLLLTFVSELLVFACLLAGRLDITIARTYALLVLIALAPLGLELELRYLLSKKRGAETVRTATGFATEDAYTLLGVLGLSLIGSVLLQIPPALSALQILFITCVARLLLSGQALQSLPYKTDQAWRVAITTLICYGSFVFYFIRHYLDPRFADSVNPLTWQATSVAMATFVACQTVLIVFEARRLPQLRLGALVFALLGACYTPPLADYFSIVAPAPADWLWVVLTSSAYGALYVLRHRALDG